MLALRSLKERLSLRSRYDHQTGSSVLIVEALPINSPLVLSDKPYWVSRSRADGEGDILKIMLTEGEEGCWIFTTKKNGRWFNMRNRAKVDDNSFGMDTTHFSDYSELGEHIVHYHTHNLAIYEIAVARQIADNMITVEENKDEFTEFSPEAIRAALEIQARMSLAHIMVEPSAPDLDSYFSIIESTSDSTYQFIIFHPFGKTEVILHAVPSQAQAVIAEYVQLRESHKSEPSIELRKSIIDMVEFINTSMQGKLELKLHLNDDVPVEIGKELITS